MIENLYSEFDTDITVRVIKGKSFNENRIDFEALEKIEGVSSYTRAIEEVVILKHEKKWVNAKLIGVEDEFLSITNMQDHIVDTNSRAVLSKGGQEFALIGAGVLNKLDGVIPTDESFEKVTCYVPKRDLKIRFGKNPFRSETITLAGRVNFNREVNEECFIVSLPKSRELLKYNDQISAIYIDGKDGVDSEKLKERVQKAVGGDFIVKTNFEKNELIYKTSKSERIIVLIILLFIFVLAAFNLVASLTMLFVEKLENVKTMISFGANRRFVFNIFFTEGLLISGKGIVIGLLFGYVVCWFQWYFGWLTMPNSGGQAFPISFSLMDGILIFFLVSVLSILFSYFPVKYLTRKNLTM